MARVYRGWGLVSMSLVFVGFLAAPLTRAEELIPKGSNAYQIVTGDDPDEDRRQWDQIFNIQGYVYGTEPARFLKQNLGYLPTGRALDIAMGEGRNAVFLAENGFAVEGVDISEVALQKARRLARAHRVSINVINADLESYQIKPNSYDVILNIDYLQRSLIPQIKRGLRKGGIVVFENPTVDQLAHAGGSGLRRDFLLQKGELRELFGDFDILVYKETNDGQEAVASLIARKR